LSKKEHELATGSFPAYQKAVEQFTLSLGTKVDRPADGVTVADVLTFRGTLSQRVSGGSVNKYLLILRGAWTEAVKAGIVRENVFTKAGTVKTDHAERRAFTLPELRRILDACNQEWRTMVLCGVYLGQRLGDIASLTWRQVDLARGEVTLTTGKTGRYMVIPLAAPLTRALTALPSADTPDAPVFPEAHATAAVNRGTLSRQFSEILASAGLVERQSHKVAKRGGRDNRRTVGGLSFHCLRHTATSLLKNAGVSDVVAREFIGHDSEAVSRVYTHIETNTLRRAVDLLPDVTAN
jgi:integrase